MELAIDVPDKYLIKFGRESVYREMKHTLKWMKIKNSFRNISKELKTMNKEDYYEGIEAIRDSAWQEYERR